MVRTSAQMIGNAQNETTKVGIIYAAAAATAVKWHKMRDEYHRMGEKLKWGGREMLNECWADTFIHSHIRIGDRIGSGEKG